MLFRSANDTNGTGDRDSLDKEFKQLAAENKRVIENTKFNGQELLTGTNVAPGYNATADSSRLFEFQIGANTSTDNRVEINTANIAYAMGTVTQGDSVTFGTTATSARTAMDELDKALNAVNSLRSTFGAAQNRFDAIISNLQVSSENQAAARGRIMDADFAVESANLARAQILQQAGTAMLAQANQMPQSVLKLLQ